MGIIAGLRSENCLLSGIALLLIDHLKAGGLCTPSELSGPLIFPLRSYIIFVAAMISRFV
jgi:hypothetical protein